MKPLRVEYDVTPEDLPTAAAAVADRDPGVRKARGKAQRIVAGMILILTAFVATDFAWHQPPVLKVSMGCVGEAVIAMILRFPTRRSWGQAIRNQAAAVFTTAAGKACLGPRSVEVGPDGIAITSEFARTLVTWRGVIDVILIPDHLVVILPGPVYLCVPRRAFAADSDFERFGETVTELATVGGGLAGRAPL
jgi:hypothetical protein